MYKEEGLQRWCYFHLRKQHKTTRSQPELDSIQGLFVMNERLILAELLSERTEMSYFMWRIIYTIIFPSIMLEYETTRSQPELDSIQGLFSGPGSSVGIATDHGLDGLGSNPGGDEIFRPSRPALGPTQPHVKWVPDLSPEVKCGRSVLLTTHHFLVPRSWKSRAIPVPTLWVTPGL